MLLITGTYQPSTSRSRRRRARSPLPRLIILGNDDAARFDIGDIDAGPTGQLVIVDPTDEDSIMESRVTELHAASIMVTDVLPSTRPAEEATLLPIGDTIPWTCGVSDVLRIGGFDTWDPDMTDAELPKDPTQYSLSGTDPTTGHVGT